MVSNAYCVVLLCFLLFFFVFVLCLLCPILTVSLEGTGRLLISFRSLNKHDHYWHFLFLGILFFIPPSLSLLFWKDKIIIPFNKISNYSQFSNRSGNFYTSPFQITWVNRHLIVELGEEFEYTKGVIRIHISEKNRQRYGRKKNDIRTNNDLQSIYIKLKIE